MKKEKFNLKNVASKFILLIFAVTVVISFNACNKDDPEEKSDDYEAGNIPGLGNAEGDLTGTAFRLPDGVELVGDITGVATQYYYWDFSSYSSAFNHPFINKNDEVETKSFTFRMQQDDELTKNCFGSGVGYVDLFLKLRNVRSNPVTVTFPAATIVVSKAGDCQNGILIKKATITIPANSDYNLCLAFYCGNLSKHVAGTYDVYIFGVVSDAKPLLELCDRVKSKKINIEEFSRSSMSDLTTYSDQASRLQSIVWNVTDGNGLTQNDIAYISSLPSN